MTKATLKESFLEIQKFTRLFTSGFGFVVVILLAMIILLLPGFLRDSDLKIGEESYYHFRIAENIINGRFYDDLSFSGRDNFIGLGWAGLIGIASFIFNIGVEEAASVLLFLFGLSSVFVFYVILRNFDMKIRIISSLVLIFSPAFIYLFSVSNRFVLPIFLCLLMVYFILKKSYFRAGLSYLLIPFFNIESAIFILMLIFGYFLFLKTKKWLFVLCLISLIFLIFGEWNKDFISDLGANIGISIFSIFLVLIGFSLFWKKKRFLFFYGICLLLFIFSIKFFWIVFYLNFFLSILVAICFIELFNMKWESNLIKNLTLFFLICGLLFSSFSFVDNLSKEKPDESIFIGLGKIPDKAVVFSHYSNGHWISYAGKKNVMDGFFDFPNVKERKRDLRVIFESRDYEVSERLLDKYNVDYVLVDKDMRKDLWKGEEEGLLWLLKYSEKFEEILDDYIGVWEYKRRV